MQEIVQRINLCLPSAKKGLPFNIIPIYVRNSLEDKSMLFTYSYLMQRKKIETWVASPESRKYFGIKTTTFLQRIEKNYPLIKSTVKDFFFMGLAIKIAVSVSWWVTPMNLR